MDTSSHLIIVSILEARNICKENYKCKDYVLVEARFNNECLLSDRIPLTSPNPELLTELCWELDRKSLHLFRKERKPIKLQCFLEDGNQSHKQLVGYIILDLREAQESYEPQFTWRPLLHSKFKGLAHLRPELLVCLQFVKSSDLGGCNEKADIHSKLCNNPSKHTDNSTQRSIKSGISPSIRMSETDGFTVNNEDLEIDINVRLHNGSFHIWDGKKSLPCDKKLFLTLKILRSSNLQKLTKLPAKLKEIKLFYFKVNLFGTSFRGNDFIDLRSENDRNEEMLIQLVVDSISTLSAYLHIHFLELQLCDNKSKVLGFTTINIADVVHENEELSKICGRFQLLSENGALACEEPYPMVELAIQIKKVAQENENKPKEISTMFSPIQNENRQLKHHYCLTIDVRSIRINHSNNFPRGPCLVRYSYPIFREKEFLTSEVEISSSSKEYIFEEGFSAYNFLASPEKLESTFMHIPFILELIDVTQTHKPMGVAKIKLENLFKSLTSDNKEIKSLHLPIQGPKGLSIGEIHVILKLKTFDSEGDDCLADESSHYMTCVNSSLDLDDMNGFLMDAALEVEMWKKKQLDAFKKDIKRRESIFLDELEKNLRQKEEEHATDIAVRMERIHELENKLKASFQEIESQAELLEERKRELDEREESIFQRLGKLDEEILKTVSKEINCNNKNQLQNSDQMKKLETIKNKLEAQIDVLESKLEDKVRLIQAYENKYGKLLATATNLTGTVIKPINNGVTRTKFIRENLSRHSPPSVNLKQSQKVPMSHKATDFVLDSDRKAKALLLQIEKGKKELLSSGLSPSHPIIQEINSHLNQ